MSVPPSTLVTGGPEANPPSATLREIAGSLRLHRRTSLRAVFGELILDDLAVELPNINAACPQPGLVTTAVDNHQQPAGNVGARVYAGDRGPEANPGERPPAT
jgi:hypothetical protein